MIDERKTKAYHDRVIAEISQNHRKVDYFTRQAERCKKIYAYTKIEAAYIGLYMDGQRRKINIFVKKEPNWL